MMTMSIDGPPSVLRRVPFDAKLDCWPVSFPPMLTQSTSTPATVRIKANGSRLVGVFVNP